MKKIALWLVLLLAGLLRFYNNTAVALWHDEAFSALYISKYGWGEMMHRIILDVHPPLYYIVLRLWGYIFGDGLLSLRGMSIILGVATVWAGYLLIKKAFKSENWALLAALFLAINPFQIQYALEARMYTLGTFLVLLSGYFLLMALETQSKKYWVYHAVTVAGCALTHYFLLFSVATYGLYWLYYVISKHRSVFYKTKDFIYGACAYIFSAILYIPWIPSFIEQNTRVQSGYWIQAPDRWAIPGTIWKIVFGGQGMNRSALAIGTIVALTILVYFVIKFKEKEKWLVALGLAFPFLAAIAMSIKTAIYLDRYFVFSSLFISLVLALSFLKISYQTLKKILIVMFILATSFAFFKNWQDMDVKNLATQRQINKKPGMAKASELVNENFNKDDKIFVASSFIFFTFQYYNHTGIKPLLLSSIPLKDIPHYAGTAILAEDDLQITENGLVPPSATPKNSNVWIIWTTGFGGSKPTAPGNWSLIMEQEFPDTPGFKGSIYVSQYNVK
jgi:4-amino-4-deoxy-L-arabinose transferase-like glycosyltransferase